MRSKNPAGRGPNGFFIEHFLANLARGWPELVDRYAALYDGRAYLPRDVTEPVRRTVRELARRHDVGDRRTVRLEPPEETDRAIEQLSFPLAPGLPPAPLVPPGGVTVD